MSLHESGDGIAKSDSLNTAYQDTKAERQ